MVEVWRLERAGESLEGGFNQIHFIHSWNSKFKIIKFKKINKVINLGRATSIICFRISNLYKITLKIKPIYTSYVSCSIKDNFIV